MAAMRRVRNCNVDFKSAALVERREPANRTLAVPKSFSLAYFGNLDGSASVQLSVIEAALADKSRGDQSDFH